MKRLSFLFRPGWIALAIVVGAFAYLCFTVLAPWQLGKNTSMSRENNQINASLTAHPVPVTSVLPQQDSAAPDSQWHRVDATGRYLTDKQILARLRVIDGDPAFEVLAPFQVEGGPVVLVDRGYVRPEQGSKVPDIPPPPSGPVSITARLRDSEIAPEDKAPFVGDGHQQVYAIDTSQLAPLFGVPLAGSYLQLVEDQPGGLGVIGLPHLDSGPFLSYGIQWIAFGIIAPIGLGYFAYSEIKARRRERVQNPPVEPEHTGPADPVTVEQKLADRYGRRR
jgi:cytochrome oxidase assembly protein ShyY1